MKRKPLPIRSRIACRFMISILCCVSCFALNVDAQIFDAREQNLVNGLRDRGLHSLAEKHCVELRQRDGLTAVDHASIAIERIRNQAAAANSGTDQRARWEKVDQIAEQFNRAQPSNPRAVLVGLQQALAHISFANTIQREVAARSASEERRKVGLKELRKARTLLDQNRRTAMDLLKQSANGNRPEGSLSSEQLRTLITSFDYQLAVVNLTNAQLLSNETETERIDRIDSLGRVLEQLSAVRASVANNRSLWWKTWINEATCRRMMGDLNAANRLLQTTRSNKRPASTDELLLQEEIELAIAVGDAKQMQLLSVKAQKMRVGVETQIAILRLLVAAGQIESASELAAKIASRAEPYWTRRADLALLSGDASVDRAAVAGNAEIRLLLQAAQKAEKAGNLDAALKGYRSVAESQFSSGDQSSGLATTALAGQILEKQSRHAEAAAIYLKPAAAYREQPASASVHLRGCWNLSKAQSTKAAKSDSFPDALKFHIETWPESDSANQARLWLGSVLASRKKFDDALVVLVPTSSTSRHFPAAVKLARSACRKQLAIVEAQNATTVPVAKRMIQLWQDAFIACDNSAKPSVAVAMAELGFAWKGEPNLNSRTRLEGLASLPSSSSNAEFLYWLGVARGSVAKAVSANALPFEESMVRQLLRSLKRMQPDRTLAAVKLKIAEHAVAASGNKKAKIEFELHRGLALIESGQQQVGIEALQQLVESNPGNLAAKLALARVSSPENAIQQWRSIASRTKAQSDAWFEAKYNVAKLLSQSGKRGEAEKMLKYIKAIPPGWDRSKLSSDFDRLLEKVSR